MSSIEVIAVLSLLAAAVAQHVKVEPAVFGFVGNQVVLRCQFVDPASSVQVTQVTWVKDPSGAKINMAVHNPKYGTNYPVDTNNRIHFRNASLTDASLVIDRLLMSDDGIYSCEFATYPEGNQEAATNLTVLAEPEIRGSPLLVKSGKSPVPVASCIAAGGKPPASITWRGNVPGNATTELTQNADGTTTVTSQYQAVPSSELDGVMLECVVTHRTLERPKVISNALSIQYPPIVTIEGYDDNWYLDREHASLTCNVKANPAASDYRWYMNGGDVPSGVRIVGHQLTVDRVTYQVNGTFSCEASNSLGRTNGNIDIFVREHKAVVTSNAGAIAGGVIGGILALLLLACLAGFLLQRRRRGGEAAGSYDPKTRVFGDGNGAARPDFTYRPDSDSEKGPSLAPTTPTTTVTAPAETEILLQSPPPTYNDYQDEEEEDEKGPISSDPMLEDDMESQRDGSIISKKAVYV
ncbi:nectin-1-like isoform X2 [Hypanus sabinus]|uniref:nectin-1-like isoform X2 n=1 Tax=Hypanus sabinus TaxID=79690 RepID=UPI0028C44A17|nr:nectin-1-like isoform X2 [Hypanus sabinus]